MKIIIVGATGTLGKKVTEVLAKEHDIIRVGSKSGDIQVDISSEASIKEMYKKADPFDAIISTTGWGLTVS